MTWYCPNCNSIFDEPDSVKDYVVNDPYLDGPIISVCPHCGDDEFVEAIQCDGCGEYIAGEYIKTCCDECYCENCYTVHDATEI